MRDELNLPRRNRRQRGAMLLFCGADLPALIGQQFEIQGVRFEGVEESRPCNWMNVALGPGAEERNGVAGGRDASDSFPTGS